MYDPSAQIIPTERDKTSNDSSAPHRAGTSTCRRQLSHRPHKHIRAENRARTRLFPLGEVLTAGKNVISFRTTVRSRTGSFTFRMCAMLLDMPDRNTSLRRYKNSEHLLAVFFAGCPGVMMFMFYLMYLTVSRPLRIYAGTCPIVSPALSRRHLYRNVAHSQLSAQDLCRGVSHSQPCAQPPSLI